MINPIKIGERLASYALSNFDTYCNEFMNQSPEQIRAYLDGAKGLMAFFGLLNPFSGMSLRRSAAIYVLGRTSDTKPQ